MARVKSVPCDGLGGYEKKRISASIRQVWQRCMARREAIKRVAVRVGDDYFYTCEKCSKRSPQIKVDHVSPVGSLDGNFIERLFCSSDKLQCLCNGCHKEKTKIERRANK